MLPVLSGIPLVLVESIPALSGIELLMLVSVRLVSDAVESPEDFLFSELHATSIDKTKPAAIKNLVFIIFGFVLLFSILSIYKTTADVTKWFY